MALAISVAACGRSTPARGQLATRVECEAYAAKLLSLAAPTARDAAAQVGRDKPSEAELVRCMERMTSEEIACATRAKTVDEALACKPTVDPRPAALRYTAEECERYERALRDGALGGLDRSPDHVEMANNLGKAGERECDHWLTRERFACVVKATTIDQIAACPP